jgi:predicted secreted protein
MSKVRFALIGIALIVGLATIPAMAADRALAEIRGYSEDGRYFAFEEFGVQDGSGFAYSTYYMIDLSQDRWVVGTPVQDMAESEDITLDAIRKRAAGDAASRLDDLGITVPAEVAAAIGDGAVDTEGKSLSFGLPRYSAPGSVLGKYTLSLKTFTAEAAAPCQDWFGAVAKGFIAKLGDSGPAREVHRDGVLPRSRGCPEDYRIYGVYVPFGATDISHSVALISVFAHGFEGLDRRFIAVPLAYDKGGS